MLQFFYLCIGVDLVRDSKLQVTGLPTLGGYPVIIGGVLGLQAGFPPFLVILALAVGGMGYWLHKNGVTPGAVPTGEMLAAK